MWAIQMIWLWDLQILALIPPRFLYYMEGCILGIQQTAICAVHLESGHRGEVGISLAFCAGKTLLARACAAQTNATFLKLAGPQLVQMFIGDGAKLVRDAFALAKEKSPCIIFIDEIDAIGTKRFDSEVSGDREVQRTMLELLNQLDGFSSDASIKVCRILACYGSLKEPHLCMA